MSGKNCPPDSASPPCGFLLAYYLKLKLEEAKLSPVVDMAQYIR
jgi:hypothetical protein